MESKDDEYDTKQNVGRSSSLKNRQVRREKKLLSNNKKIKHDQKKWNNEDRIL